MSGTFTYARQGRNIGTLILLPIIWLVLLAAWVWLDAALLILGVIALFTLPAVWDLINNPAAGLTLTDLSLKWHSGSRTAQIALAEIEHIRLDTRLDFSVRATVYLRSGRKIRVPFEATPPHNAFEQALTLRTIKTKRHHFSLRQ